MFLLFFFILVLTNYIIVADMQDKYKVGYAIALILIVGLSILFHFI